MRAERVRVGGLVEGAVGRGGDLLELGRCRAPSTPSTRRRRSPRPASVPTRWSSPSRRPRRAGRPPRAGRCRRCSHRRRTSRSPPRRSSRCRRSPDRTRARRLGHSRQSCRLPAVVARRFVVSGVVDDRSSGSPTIASSAVYIPAPVDVPPDGVEPLDRVGDGCPVVWSAGPPPAHRHRRPRHRPRRAEAAPRPGRAAPSRAASSRVGVDVVGGHAVRHVDGDDHRAGALRQGQDSPPDGRALNRRTATPASSTAGRQVATPSEAGHGSRRSAAPRSARRARSTQRRGAARSRRRPPARG